MRPILITMLLVATLWCFGQQNPQLTESHKDIAVKAVHQPFIDVSTNSATAFDMYQHGAAPEETVIGKTWYDLQSNTLLANRFHVYADGTMGAVWTMGVESPPTFPDRGTGYNFYDGTAWGPQPEERLESVRTGWPSYAPLGENGEIVFSHDFTNNLVYLTREAKGSGEWNEFTFENPSDEHVLAWSRMATDGNSVHVLATTLPEGNGGTPYEGMDGAMLYSRSTDGGETWDIENELLDGTGPDYYNSISADEYVWAEPRNGNIAFLCADAWHDMFMMKSTDNGETWEKTVIWEHPYPFFEWEETITDTFYCVDNSASITLDKNGKAHVVFGINRVLHSEPGTEYFLFPYVDGIGYWNEDMETFSDNIHTLDPYGHPDSELVENENLIGWYQDVNGNGQMDLLDDLIYYRELGLSTMPTITIDEQGKVFVFYSSTTEGYDNGVNNYKHLWARTSPDNGLSWGEFHDITINPIHTFDECVYPVAAQNTTETDVHLIYQADEMPGIALDDQHEWVENRIYHSRIPKADIVGITNPVNRTNDLVVSQNQPNPFTRETTIKISSAESSHMLFEMYDLAGKLVRSQNLGVVKGDYTLNLEAADLKPGSYLYRIITNNRVITKKMIIQ
ncbi:MAG: T9SS type A sorting domain-containing protein [Bacteroidales bacterium]|nr:T9SS type A sorting domain-containing protein [Bacteroidales bacterium]